MIINEGDSEELRKVKRKWCEREMRQTHEWGALKLPSGIPIGCKIEQPRAQAEHISTPTYKQKIPAGNGITRNCYINGANRKEYAMGFAGRARKQGEMNSGEGVSDTVREGNPIS